MKWNSFLPHYFLLSCLLLLFSLCHTHSHMNTNTNLNHTLEFASFSYNNIFQVPHFQFPNPTPFWKITASSWLPSTSFLTHQLLFLTPYHFLLLLLLHLVLFLVAASMFSLQRVTFEVPLVLSSLPLLSNRLWVRPMWLTLLQQTPLILSLP